MAHCEEQCTYFVIYILETDTVVEFFVKTTAEIAAHEDEGTVFQVFAPVLDVIKNKFLSDFSLMHPEVSRYITLALFFTRSVPLAEVLFAGHFFPNLFQLNHHSLIIIENN